MARPVSADSRGIIDPVTAARRYDHQRHDPSPAVGRFVRWYAVMTWDLGGDSGDDSNDNTHTQQVLGHPVVNLVFQAATANLAGVQRTRTRHELRGRGWALGAMFRPAGFRPLVDGPLSQLTGRMLLPATVLGPSVDALHQRLRAASGWPERLQLVDDYLAERLPAEPQPSEATTVIAERIAEDRSLVRVDQVAAAYDLSVRALQRRFADHVGVSPKWVIQRYRLYDAAEAAARGEDVHWARLAAELGYADQAHLVRSFTAAIGVPPDRYARSVHGNTN